RRAARAALLPGVFGLFGSNAELALERRNLLAKLLLLLAAADHLHLDLADLHGKVAPGIGVTVAAGFVLLVEDLLLVGLIGFLQLAQPFAGLGQGNDVGGLLGVGFLFDLIFERAHPLLHIGVRAGACRRTLPRHGG